MESYEPENALNIGRAKSHRPLESTVDAGLRRRTRLLVACAYTLVGLFVLSAGACVSSGAFTQARGFELAPDTKVSLLPSRDPHGYLLALEDALFVAGFDVAPPETSRSGVQIDRASEASVDGSSATTSSTTFVSEGTYLPTHIGVSLSYTYSEYPSATYYTRAFIRVMDVRDQRLLASYQANGSELRPLSMDSLIEDFALQLSALVR